MTLEQRKKLKKWGLPQDTERLLGSCPDLEQLLEFADKKLGGVVLYREKDWRVTVNTFEFRPTLSDPDPKVAVYKLLEKILEE